MGLPLQKRIHTKTTTKHNDKQTKNTLLYYRFFDPLKI